MNSPNSRDNSAGRFGTFGGVFTPCTLTILGVIMFLRFGYVVGQAGLWYALAIVAAAKALTTLTTLSLSAIATNTRVKGGGAYFLISRSLGVEFGGAIGLVFFIAQAISVAMYVIGFAEAVVATFSSLGLSVVAIATLTNFVVLVCVLIGAGWTIKIQYFVLAILAASLVSFFVGAAQTFDSALLAANSGPHFSEGESFFTIFALFFPAVTGIMAGANMSGDLRDPGRSIPRGTLLSVVVTGAIYMSMAAMLAAARPHETLAGDGMVVGEVSRWTVLITAGVFAATLSSALGSMMGAPRILQAFARDNVFGWLRTFSAGSGAGNEPRRATVATCIIAQVCIVSADLNTIAPLITMFFLITYGLLNLATFYEAVTKNPSYRPRFRFCHWTTSLVGAAGCVFVMFLIDWVWASVSVVLIGLLHWQIGRSEVEARWGDLHSGLLFERTRKNLLKLEEERYHPKNWRPIVLALSGGGWNRPHLAVCGHWFTSGHGILTLGQVIQGDIENHLERRNSQERILHGFIREQELEAFPAVVVAPYLSDGIESLVQCLGLGAMRPNTLLLGWPNDAERAVVFASTLRTVAGMSCNIIAARFRDDAEDPWLAPAGTIDVWWRGRGNGELMLLLAHLLTTNNEWRTRPIRILRVIENEAGRSEVLQHLSKLTEGARIRAKAEVIVSDAPDHRRTIQRHSRDAAIVLLGFEPPAEGDEEAFYQRMENWAGSLPRVVFVDSTGKMSLES